MRGNGWMFPEERRGCLVCLSMLHVNQTAAHDDIIRALDSLPSSFLSSSSSSSPSSSSSMGPSQGDRTERETTVAGFLSASNDQLVKAWSLDGTQLGEFEGHAAFVFGKVSPLLFSSFSSTRSVLLPFPFRSLPCQPLSPFSSLHVFPSFFFSSSFPSDVDVLFSLSLTSYLSYVLGPTVRTHEYMCRVKHTYIPICVSFASRYLCTVHVGRRGSYRSPGDS